MKQATLVVKLSKDTHVPVVGVTPIEALLLTAEHHRNCGGHPIEADKIDPKLVTEIQVPTGKVLKDKAGIETPEMRTRTNDEELDRLRGKYNPNKVKAILAEVRDLPTEYAEAVERGVKVVLPSSALSTTKLI